MTLEMKNFNDVMQSPNTIKLLYLRLEVLTYVKSVPEEWQLNTEYLVGQIVKVVLPGITRYYRCLKQHNSNDAAVTMIDYWRELDEADSAIEQKFSTSGVNFGDWLVNESYAVKMSDIDPSSSINFNSEQNVTRTITLNIKNTADPETLKGIHLWGHSFNHDKHRWWLDKRLNVYVQVRLANDPDKRVFEMPMGRYIITGMSSSHTLTAHPLTVIQASSGEVLFASRRGKFDKNVTIDKGISIIDGIKRILIQGGEKPENILISPDVVGETGITYIPVWTVGESYSVNDYVQITQNDLIRFFKCIDGNIAASGNHPITGVNRNYYWIEVSNSSISNHDYRDIINVSTNNWTVSNLTGYASDAHTVIEEDYASYRTKNSSTKFTFHNLHHIDDDDLPITLAEYNFKDENNQLKAYDFSQWDTAAFWARSSMDLNDNSFQIWFYNGEWNGTNFVQTGVPIKLAVKELVGNGSKVRLSTDYSSVTMDMEQMEIWRMMIIPLGFVNELKSIYKMELKMNKPVGRFGYELFNFWIDDILVSRMNNVLDNPLNYTISQNRWQAVAEMAQLLKCDAYYTRDGYFLLTKTHLVTPNYYIDNIRYYLKQYFGPYNTNPDPTVNKQGPFNLIEDNSSFQFEPFYSFLNWTVTMTNMQERARVLRISLENLYNEHRLVQPNTYAGTFLIDLSIIPEPRRTRILNWCTGVTAGGFPVGIFSYDPVNNELTANLVTVLYWNYNNRHNVIYNSPALDTLFSVNVGNPATGSNSDPNLYLAKNNEFQAAFTIFKEGNYRVPREPEVIVFSDLQESWRKKIEPNRTHPDKRDSFYAGGTNTFEEKELSNHIIAYGGSEANPIQGKAEAILTENGLNLRVKGEFINERGRIRGINDFQQQTWMNNQAYNVTWSPEWLGNHFYYRDTYVKHYDEYTQTYETFRCLQWHISSSISEPLIGDNWEIYWKKSMTGEFLNADTDIDKLYVGCFNADIIKEILGDDRFKSLTESPINDFTVEKIGDYIYQYNNGQLDGNLKYTWELLNRVIFELKEKLKYSNKFSFQIKPYYGLDCYDIIKVHDRFLDLIGTKEDLSTGNEFCQGERFKIQTISIPLNGNYMSITAIRDYDPDLNIPSFDQSHKVRFGPYFYGRDLISDNNIDYRSTASNYDEITGKISQYYFNQNNPMERSNIGQGSLVTGHEHENVDAINNVEPPIPINGSQNLAHFAVQTYPYKVKMTTTKVKPYFYKCVIDCEENKEETGIDPVKIDSYYPRVGTPTIEYDKDKHEIIMYFPAVLYDGAYQEVKSDINNVPQYAFENAFMYGPNGLIKVPDIKYNDKNLVLVLPLEPGLAVNDFDIELNPLMLYIKKQNGLFEELSWFSISMRDGKLKITEQENDINIYYPGNHGKRLGYNLIDAVRHSGYATAAGWLPNLDSHASAAYWMPGNTGLNGRDWELNKLYKVGELVRIPAIYSYMKVKRFVYLKCIVEHTSSYNNRPVFDTAIDGLLFAPEVDDNTGAYTPNPNAPVYWEIDISYNQIPWVMGNPTGLTYDFYNLAFYEGEMSLEEGYAATPVKNGDLVWEGLLGSDDRLYRSYKWMYKNGRLIYVYPLPKGYANKDVVSIIYKGKSVAPFSIANFSMQANILPVNSKPKGTIVVKHIWSYRNIDYNIINQEVYTNVSELVVHAIKNPNWRLLTRHSEQFMSIDKNEDTQTFIFQYEPLYDWVINNNLHGLDIKMALVDNDENILVNYEDSSMVKIVDIDNFCWIKEKNVYITGKPALFLNYVMYSDRSSLTHPLITASIKYKQGHFGQFFDTACFKKVPLYVDYLNMDLSRVLKVCSFNFAKDDPKQILIRGGSNS